MPNGQTVEELTLVTLNGSASSDFETPFPGLRFQWTQLAGAVGVTINDSDQAVASFLAPDLPHPSSEPLIFELAVDDGSNTSTDATTVTVTSVPDSEDGLIARNDLYIVAPGSSNNSLDVSSNDTPSSGVTIAIASDPALGTASVSGNTILYSPTAPSGSDAFTYTIENDLGTSAPALVTVNIGEDFAVFVGNAERDEILYWSSLGGFLGTFASRSNGNLGLNAPDSLTFDDPPLFLHARSESRRTFRFDAHSGDDAGSGNDSIFVDSLSAPVGDLAVASDGRLYFTLPASNEIRYADAGFGGRFSFQHANATDGLSNPDGMVFHSGSLYVANTGDHRILEISLSGNVSEFVSSESGGLSSPHDLAFGSDGHLYVLSRVTETVYRFDGSSGAPLSFSGSSATALFSNDRNLDDPTTIAASPDRRLFVGNGGDENILVIGIPSSNTTPVVTEFVASRSHGLDDILAVEIGPAPVPNASPALDPISNRTMFEGSFLSVDIQAIDLNDDAVDLSATGLPPFATLTDNGDGTGSIAFNPGFVSANSYDVTVVADDGDLNDSASFRLTVLDVNQPTTIDPIGPRSVDEGGTLSISITARDADIGDSLAFSASGLPGFATLTDHGNRIVTVTLNPGFADAGPYEVTIRVVDNGLRPAADTESFTLSVIHVNEAPTVADQALSVDENRANGTFIGSVSASDSDAGDVLTFDVTGGSGSTAFEVDAGSGAIIVADSLQLDFESAKSLTLQILVTDGGGLTDSAVITVKLNDINEAPKASDDHSVTVDENDSVFIILSAFDPEDDALKFEVVTQPDNGSLSGEPPSLTYSPSQDFAGEDSFDFKANDGEKDSNIATVSITVIPVNEPPFADAGPDENVETGSRVTLDGSNSFDPDGDLIDFDWSVDWRIDAKPEGSLLADRDIEGRTTPNPSLSLDVDGVYVLQLIVNDGELSSEPDFVELIASTLNVPPNAEAGDDLSVSVGETALLDGSASEDPDGDDQALTYLWSFAAVPLGSNLVSSDIEERERAQARFQPDVAGDYLVTLRVSDGTDSSADNVLITASGVNVAPNARAGEDQMTALGDAVSIDGTASDDPDEGPRGLVFSWRLISIPAGSALTNSDLVDSEMSTAFFVPDVEGAYVLELEVFDGEANDFDNVMIRAARLPDPDLNNDGIVSILDVSIAGSCYGQTPPATPQITITTPADSSVLSSTAVTVSGTVIGDDVIVEVNGAIATVAGNLFTAADIPLSEGPSTILVTATTRADRCLVADTNGDQLIDLSDFSFVIASFGQSGFPTGEPVRDVATGSVAVRVRVDFP